MKKKLRNILIVCLCLIAAAGIGFVICYMVLVNKNEDVYQEAREKAKVEVPVQNEPEKEEQKVDIPIDFEELKKINPEVYAWIEIPGTNVDYPILQRPSDDAYYLNHSMDGKEGYPGSIYTEGCNRQDFTDFNTVIYGHDMKDGSMFADLHKYMDNAFLSENSEVIIYTPDKKLTYQIFAGVVYDDRHIMKTYDFDEVEGRSAFVDSLNTLRDMRSVIDESVQVNLTTDRIITLSTCIGAESNHRFLVEAVLVNEES